MILTAPCSGFIIPISQIRELRLSEEISQRRAAESGGTRGFPSKSVLVGSQRVFPGHCLGTLISHLGFHTSSTVTSDSTKHTVFRVPRGACSLARLTRTVWVSWSRAFSTPSRGPLWLPRQPGTCPVLFANSASFSITGSSSGGCARRNMILHKAHQPWVSAQTTPWGLAGIRAQVFSQRITPPSSL